MASLPLPASMAAPAWAAPRRPRVALALVVAVILIYVLLPEDTLGGRPWRPPPWRTSDLAELGAGPPPEPQDVAPGITLDPQEVDAIIDDLRPVDGAEPVTSGEDASVEPSVNLANPHNLPVRVPEPYPAHVHPMRDALGDPWPDRPEIAGEWLARDRPHVDPPEPEWPDVSVRIPSRPLSHDHMIAFSALPVPSGYVAPPRPGRKRALPQVQFDFARLGVETDDQKRLRHARRDWVRRAMVRRRPGAAS